jgi:hypothetical protein
MAVARQNRHEIVAWLPDESRRGRTPSAAGDAKVNAAGSGQRCGQPCRRHPSTATLRLVWGLAGHALRL